MKSVRKFKQFDYDLDFENINFRDNPEKYIIGKGEQGVLMIEPYKSEILPHWKFRTPEIASKSAKEIFKLYEDYKSQKDFVGMDMSRKFLQMGITRSRRYANHKSGQKYKSNPQLEMDSQKSKALRKNILPLDLDLEKAESAKRFSEYYYKITKDNEYIDMRQKHIDKYY